MADLSLVPSWPTENLVIEDEGLSVTGVAGLGIMALATPASTDRSFAEAIRRAHGLSVPEVLRSDMSDGVLLLRLSGNEMLALLRPGDDRAGEIQATLASGAYCTDVSDAWASLRLSGERVEETLARFVPIDLDRSVFPPGAVAQTVIDGVSTIIHRELDDQAMLLLIPRSFAHSMTGVLFA